MNERHILVVDDDDDVRRLLVEYLIGQERQLHVDWARDGIEALHRMAMESYRVVILDVVMPNMTGIDLLNSLESLRHERRQAPRVPPAIVVMTATPAHDLPDTVLHQFKSLVVGVFRKPLDVPALAACVHEHLA
jgi:CheY-like chemotaxis protein